MKRKKNLERAIILGLILSTGAYGTAWGSAVGIKADGTEVYIERVAGGIGIGANDVEYNGDKLSAYKEIKIHLDEKAVSGFDNTGGLYINSNNLDIPDTDFTITLDADVPAGVNGSAGIFFESDGGSSHILPNFININNYNAYIYTPSSDALKLESNLYSELDDGSVIGADVVFNGNFYAEVQNGNGMYISSVSDKEVESSVTVEGTTTIKLLGAEKVTERTENLSIAYLQSNGYVEYDPAAVYAGDSRYNFTVDKLFEHQDLRALDENGKPIRDENGNFVFTTGWLLDDTSFGNETIGKSTITLKGKTTIDINDTNETDKAYGIFAGKNGEVNINDVEITTHNKNSMGITAQNKNLIYDDEIRFEIDNTEFPGLGPMGTWLYPSLFPERTEVISETLKANLDTSANKYGSVVTMNGENNTITMAEGGKALYADAKNSTKEDAEVIIQSGANGIGTLDVKGDVVATNSGKIDLTVNKAADITGDIEATYGGTIDFALGAGADMIVSAEDNTLINTGAAANGISLMANEEANTKIGNVQAANGGVINITLGEGAYFAGRVDDYKDADGTNGWNNQQHQELFDSEFAQNVTSSGTVNMVLNGGVWDLTQQSWATNVASNGGTIYLDGDGTGGYAVHIGKLTGSDNTFVMNLKPNDLAASDMLYVYDGSEAGVQNLIINNEQEVLNALTDDGDRIRFATVAKTAADEGAGFGDDYVVRGRGVINSGFSIDYVDYEEDKQNADYTTAYNGTAGEAKPGNEYVENIYGDANAAEGVDSQNLYLVRDSSKDAGLSDSGETIVNMSRANYKNAIYMDRLNKRLGEARYINNEDDQGMWVRLRHDRIGHSGEFRSMNTMYELGYDVKQDCDNGERRLGFAVDYMRGSTSYSDIIGKGETKRYGLWLYDTWLGDKGHYADYVLKWGHLSNDFDICDKDSLMDITGDYSNNVFSASAEYGRKKDIGSDWYFEPQAQLQLARVTGADYMTSAQDTKVSVDGINSLIGRAGFRLGKDLGERSTVYVKADLLHEFLGDQTITASDATGTFRETYENKGTWYDVGFGFATAMGKNSYAFMDFEKSFGNDNDETYQINAGVQWTF